MRKRFLYCYDISDPKRLRRVHKIMQAIGDRVQLSVYECQLTSVEQVHLDENLKGAINTKEDAVFIVDLGPVRMGRAPRFRSMGVPYESMDRDVIVI